MIPEIICMVRECEQRLAEKRSASAIGKQEAIGLFQLRLFGTQACKDEAKATPM